MATTDPAGVSGISVTAHPDAHAINPYNPKVPNVPAAFEAVSSSGARHKYAGMPRVYDEIDSHVQGVAPYDNYLLLTHNENAAVSPGQPVQEQGYLLVINRTTQMLVQQNLTPNPGFSHPGGCQRIGSFLVMALENASYDESYIRFYDLSGMTDTVPPALLPYNLHRPNHGAGGVGITSYTDPDGNELYVMAVYDNGKVDLYRSNPVALNDPSLHFTMLGHQLPAADEYSEVCLVTDTQQNVYMLGFATHDLGIENDDYVYLWSVSLSTARLTALGRRHMVTQHGNLPGAVGVHFRYGAGMQVRSDLSLEFFAAQRNFWEGWMYSNTFRKPGS